MGFSLLDFVAESNRIEGIDKVQEHEIEAHKRLLALDAITIPEIEAFVKTVASADLRSRSGMNVRVGSHFPPKGGRNIPENLESILAGWFDGSRIRIPVEDVYRGHQIYEKLHPFMDGNGRSGRALWLWRMGGIDRAPLGFLHHWYYQSLEFGGER